MPMPEPFPRIALVHALEESVLPARQAFARHWPQAFAFDLLDTSLAVDRAAAGRLDDSMMSRFRALADYAVTYAGRGGRTRGILFSVTAAGALEALKAGDGDRHDSLVAEAVARLGDVDAVILGQFSLARAHDSAARATSAPIITTPRSAVEALRARVLADMTQEDRNH
jgi:hypothetical protein